MTTTVAEMLGAHPAPPAIDREALTRCIEACFVCVQTCGVCSDACLAEEMVVELRACIRTCAACATICAATGGLLSAWAEFDRDAVRAQVEACLLACRACRNECQRHADMHEHCRLCMESCRACERACRTLLETLG